MRAHSDHAACHCLHTTPCDVSCTCLNPVSSRGCSRCCSYGSREQQKATAERLVAQQNALEVARAALDGWEALAKAVGASDAGIQGLRENTP